MKLLLSVLSPFPWRITCLRHGHTLRCTSNEGHLCIRCGRHWA